MEFLAKVKTTTFKTPSGGIECRSGLFPTDIVQSEKFKKAKQNEIYVVTAKKPRTKNYLDQCFAILNLLYDNWRDEKVENMRVFRQMINIIIGNYDIVMINDKVEKITRSWSYREMDQSEFMQYVYNPLMDFAVNYMNIESDENNDARSKLIQMSLEYVGIDYNKKG
jgi:hypothetical protein